MYRADKIIEVEAPPVVDEIGQRLLRAAQIIEERGWCQDAFQQDGRVCAVGAFLIAGGFPASESGVTASVHANETLHRAAMKRLSDAAHAEYIPDWNDAADRTKEQVISALKAAAQSPISASEPK